MWGFWEGANWIPPIVALQAGLTPTPAAEAYRTSYYQVVDAGRAPANSRRLAVLRAYYGKHRVTVNGKETVIHLTKAEGAKTVDTE
jgi:hypothetical protein